MRDSLDKDFQEQYDPEFLRMSMWDQLGKILDSEDARDVVEKGKFKPVRYVVTDDDVKFKVSPTQATIIKEAVLLYPVPARREIFRDIQLSPTFSIFLNMAKILEKKKCPTKK